MHFPGTESGKRLSPGAELLPQGMSELHAFRPLSQMHFSLVGDSAHRRALSKLPNLSQPPLPPL